MIRGDAHFYVALNYVHINPVKHGYVSDPYDWPWSSLCTYAEAEGYGRKWLRGQWKAHPPGDFGKGWDD
jgi:putative transposase